MSGYFAVMFSEFLHGVQANIQCHGRVSKPLVLMVCKQIFSVEAVAPTCTPSLLLLHIILRSKIGGHICQNNSGIEIFSIKAQGLAYNTKDQLESNAPSIVSEICAF